jgi:hypothetical protein
MCGLKPRLRHSASSYRSETWTDLPSAKSVWPLIVFSAQLVGFRKKSGLLTLTPTSRTSSGIPCRIVGNGSDTMLTVASCLSTNNAARTVTLPRSNGPATAATTIAIPNGAPLYGPVRYIRPFVKNGLLPAPAPAVTLPIFEPAGHKAALAWPSGHSSALAILPGRPLGRCTVRALNS